MSANQASNDRFRKAKKAEKLRRRCEERGTFPQRGREEEEVWE